MRTRLNALKNNATALKIPLTRLVKGKGRVPKTQARLKSDIAAKRLFKSLSIRLDKLEKDILFSKPLKVTKSQKKLMQRYYTLVLKMRRRGLLKRAESQQLLLRPW